ncbi:MAG: UPF0146 family protein [Nitrospirota bacterium]
MTKKIEAYNNTKDNPLQQYIGLKVVVDDITGPDLSIYAGLDLLYSLRPPPELIPYMVRLARMLPADLIVKPLASEHPGRQLICHRNTTFYLWNYIYRKNTSVCHSREKGNPDWQ